MDCANSGTGEWCERGFLGERQPGRHGIGTKADLNRDFLQFLTERSADRFGDGLHGFAPGRTTSQAGGEQVHRDGEIRDSPGVSTLSLCLAQAGERTRYRCGGHDAGERAEHASQEECADQAHQDGGGSAEELVVQVLGGVFIGSVDG
ncbi:hypothetical protein Acsp03_57310 [Actinomadura sp. NBRC 104412]|nr:hypothetical protein Acsp03_57310 [Actinomadura sp. NBRC 104412]